MKKVLIIGSPGAGKSTFARKLRDVTGLPLYYLDLIWHKPDKSNITREAFDTILDGILKSDAWIIDGNYRRTMEMRIKACDTIFFMDLPMSICLEGAKARVGKKREELPFVEEELDEEFKTRIEDFSVTHLPLIYDLLEKYKDEKSIIVFRSRAEADDYIERVKID